MEITEIKLTDEIKVSKNSWTVKRNGKTAGIIRNITSFSVLNDTNSRIAFEVYGKIKKYLNREARINSGSFFEKSGKLYYLYSMNEENFYNNQLENFGKPLSPNDYERFLIRKNAIEEMSKSGEITVISAKM